MPIDYPAEASALSITQPVPVGRYTDTGTAAVIDLSKPGIAVAMHGGGGTMLLHNIAVSAARMPDTLIWMIDTNHGGLTAPWVVDQEEIVPDWVAATPDAAVAMMQAAVRIARARRAYFASEMLRRDTTVLPVSPKLPHIVILIDKPDETAEALPFAAELAELDRIGQAMRVTTFTAFRRSTAEWIPGTTKMNADSVFCGRVHTTIEFAYLMEYIAGAGPEDLHHPGQFFLKRGSDRTPRKLDAFRTTAGLLRHTSREVAPLRIGTVLDQPSVDAANADADGDAYAIRWAREDTAKWLAWLRNEEPAD
jgi:S-DNA-T family DNA segregation ATPase FtsK/SpoIIIE